MRTWPPGTASTTAITWPPNPGPMCCRWRSRPCGSCRL
nr:MAG TPA: hypothetical protein [Caudoviricetes sp.]